MKGGMIMNKSKVCRHRKFSRLLWIIVTITLTALTISFVQDFLIKYEEMTTKTLFKTHHRLISTLNFPAISVCATSSFTYTKVYGFLNAYILKNPTLRTSVNLTKILKSFTLVDATQNDLEEMDVVINVHNITMKDVYYITAQNCDELLLRCKWEGQVRPCSELFKMVSAGGSICCSFNYHIPPSTLITKKFLKTMNYKNGGGLSLITRPIRDKFFYRSDYGRNIRIIVHHVFNYPISNEHDVYASMQKETNVEIESIYNTADPKLRQLPIRSRDCVFAWERNLQYFPIYSHPNCILECRVNKIIRACGCATYFYPSFNTTVCPPSKLFCNILNDNLDIDTNADGTMSIKNCDCPDDCTVLRLHYNVQSTKFIRDNFSIDEFYNDVTEGNGIVHINFSKSFTKLLERKLVLDELELASSVGGIIALFLGCSIISIFEILYFLSIRLFSNYRRLCAQNGLITVLVSMK